MDISQLLLNSLGSEGMNKISQQTGLDESTASNVMSAAIPTLLSAMATNTQRQSEANGLLSALDRDHDGSVLDDLGGFLNNPQQGNGAGILRHVLKGQRPQVESALAAKSGANAGGISKLLEIAAPLVMAYLGRQKREQGGMDSSGIASILQNLTGQSTQNSGMDIGDILNIVGSLSGGGQQSRGGGGIGGLLRGLFGRR